MKYDFHRPLGGKAGVYAIGAAVVAVVVAVIWMILAALSRWMSNLSVVPRID